MRDITDLMNAYRECSRNLWNVYFSKRENIGGALDAFGQIRELLFESLVLDELYYEGDADAEEAAGPVLMVVPRSRSPILIRRPSDDGNRYWDAVKDMVVGPDEITLVFLDYFDFYQVPLTNLYYCRCRVVRFPNHPEYEGREALVQALDVTVYYDEPPEDPAAA